MLWYKLWRMDPAGPPCSLSPHSCSPLSYPSALLPSCLLLCGHGGEGGASSEDYPFPQRLLGYGATRKIFSRQRRVANTRHGPTNSAQRTKLNPLGWLVWCIRLGSVSQLTCESSTRTLWLQQTQGRSTTSSPRIHSTTTTHLCFDR